MLDTKTKLQNEISRLLDENLVDVFIAFKKLSISIFLNVVFISIPFVQFVFSFLANHID